METNNQNKHSEYDGIVEQNNPMPSWWVWSFIFTVIFGFIYWIHYTVGGGETLYQEYSVQLKEFENKNGAKGAIETEDSLSQFAKNEANLLVGAKVFAEKCAICHGANLEGKIGPNLTDNFWINGQGKLTDIHEIIKKGVPAKGMPPWESMLKPDEIKSLTGYVFSKIGSKPANPKDPQGNEVK